jgi:hypothetical protein
MIMGYLRGGDLHPACSQSFTGMDGTSGLSIAVACSTQNRTIAAGSTAIVRSDDRTEGSLVILLARSMCCCINRQSVRVSRGALLPLDQSHRPDSRINRLDLFGPVTSMD